MSLSTYLLKQLPLLYLLKKRTPSVKKSLALKLIPLCSHDSGVKIRGGKVYYVLFMSAM